MRRIGLLLMIIGFSLGAVDAILLTLILIRAANKGVDAWAVGVTAAAFGFVVVGGALFGSTNRRGARRGGTNTP